MRDEDGNPIRCSCGKVCYTEREAGMFLNGVRKRHKSRSIRRMVCSNNDTVKRKFHCEICGYWHLTHWRQYNVDRKRKYDR